MYVLHVVVYVFTIYHLLVADESIVITCKERLVVNGSLRISMGCTKPSLSLMLYILWLNFKVMSKMFDTLLKYM